MSSRQQPNGNACSGAQISPCNREAGVTAVGCEAPPPPLLRLSRYPLPLDMCCCYSGCVDCWCYCILEGTCTAQLLKEGMMQLFSVANATLSECLRLICCLICC